MLKNITFSVEEDLLREGRRRANLENTSLNALFREWLAQYVAQAEAAERVERYDALMEKLGLRTVRKFTREEMNERR